MSVTRDAAIVHVHDFLDASPRFDLFDAAAESGEAIVRQTIGIV